MRADGWFRTGDKGFLTAEGRISFQGRIGDDYKSRGFNVSPAEIEAVAATHPAVNQAAVVGVPDALHGALGVLFVIPERDLRCDAEALLGFLREKLAGYKVPAAAIFVDAFPLTEGTGKVRNSGCGRSRLHAARVPRAIHNSAGAAG
jgi:acyl-CoA synthetase (AMP-forming)/AMP-acid ligase II